jgi:uncharacterized protein YndB with AHSA1/START domain
MSSLAPATSINRSIIVEAPLERAFEVFTKKFGSFKPVEHNLLAVKIAETIFEPRVGGHIYDRGVDGSECRWARVLAFEPPHRLLLSWNISPRWQIETDPEKASEWEVRFTAVTPEQSAPELRSNTGSSSATGKDGKASATALEATEGGRFTCGDMRSSWRAVLEVMGSSGG